MISGSLHPWSAIRFEPPLRTPCGTQRSGNLASLHHLRNAVLNAFLLYGLPHSLVRNVSESGGLGQASIAAVSSGGIGIETTDGLRRLFFSCVNSNQVPPLLRCCQPSEMASPLLAVTVSINSRARRSRVPSG